MFKKKKMKIFMNALQLKHWTPKEAEELFLEALLIESPIIIL